MAKDLAPDPDRLERALGDLGPASVGRSAPAARPARGGNFLGQVWHGWLKVAEVIGTIQMMVILSLIYWTVLAATAIPFKLLSDPLRLRRSEGSGWIQRPPVSHSVDTMRQQY